MQFHGDDPVNKALFNITENSKLSALGNNGSFMDPVKTSNPAEDIMLDVPLHPKTNTPMEFNAMTVDLASEIEMATYISLQNYILKGDIIIVESQRYFSMDVKEGNDRMPVFLSWFQPQGMFVKGTLVLNKKDPVHLEKEMEHNNKVLEQLNENDDLITKHRSKGKGSRKKNTKK